MKLKLTTKKIEEEPVTRRVVRVEEYPDGVSLLVDGYYILKLNNEGTIRRTGNVPAFLGFRVDTIGRVEIG